MNDSATDCATVTLELHASDHPALVLTQGEKAIRVELVHARHVIAALTDAAVGLAVSLIPRMEMKDE